MILETLLLMNRQREAMEQAKIVSHNLTRETWFSTQSTAFSLMAMGRLAEKLSGTLDTERKTATGSKISKSSIRDTYFHFIT